MMADVLKVGKGRLEFSRWCMSVIFRHGGCGELAHGFQEMGFVFDHKSVYLGDHMYVLFRACISSIMISSHHERL